MKRYFFLGLLIGAGIALINANPAWAFVEDQAPTFANGGVDPAKTGDPASVAAAQSALEQFFGYTNREYARQGYANAWLMRDELGNAQASWLDKTLPLACGRLVEGWKSRTWSAERGWRHEAPSAQIASGASVSCDFRAPTHANGGIDPSRTIDPPAVAAAQLALDAFFRETNRAYSPAGFSNPWSMREELGNGATSWLDMTLPLARGELVGGWRNRNWIPGKGWRNEALLSMPLLQGVVSPTATSGGQVIAWTPDRLSATPIVEHGIEPPRKPIGPPGDTQAVRIIASAAIPLDETLDSEVQRGR